MEFFSLLSMLLLYTVIIEKKTSKIMLGALALSLGLGVLCKITSVMIVFAAVIILLVYNQWGSKKKILGFAFFSMLLPLGWYGIVLYLNPADLVQEYNLRAFASTGITSTPLSTLIDVTWAFLQQWQMSASFAFLGVISLIYLASSREKKYVFILVPFLIMLSLQYVSGYTGSYLFLPVCGFLAIASGLFMAKTFQGNRTRLLGIFLFAFFILFYDQAYPAYALPTTDLEAFLLLLVLFASLALVAERLNKKFEIHTDLKSLLLVLALIFVVAVSGVVAYQDYQMISTNGTAYSPLTSDISQNQRSVINFLNAHVEKNDIVYCESIFVFQLKCDPRDDQFVTNATVQEAKYAVADPFWEKYDLNPFYDIDIGAPRNWITQNWILVATYGNYGIYENPNVCSQNSTATADSFELQIRDMVPTDSSIALNFQRMNNQTLFKQVLADGKVSTTNISEKSFLDDVSNIVSQSYYETSCSFAVIRCENTFYLMTNNNTAVTCLPTAVISTEQASITNLNFANNHRVIATVQNTGTNNLTIQSAKIDGNNANLVSNGSFDIAHGTSLSVDITPISGNFTDGTQYTVELITAEGNTLSYTAIFTK